MDETLKKRLVGATVLVSLVVIFVPMLLDDEPMVDSGITETNIPPKPANDFSSRVIPAEDEELAIPPVTARPEIVPLVPPPAPAAVAEPPKPAEPAVPAAPAAPVAADKKTVVAEKKVEPPVQPSPAEKPQPVQPREGLAAWVIQVGSFSNRENAEKLVETIRKMKYDTFMEQADVDGKTLYRVMVGPEVERKLADQMLVKLNKDIKSLDLKGRVRSYP